MTDSILDSVKKTLGLASDYTAFDVDVLMHINSAFSTLHQIGVGPADGFAIEDKNPVWDDFLGGNKLMNPAKSYVYMRVRQLFDPPSTGYLVESYDKQIKELEWRLSVEHDLEMPVDPTDPIDDLILDGGHP